MPRETPQLAEPVIRVESVTRTFVLGDVKVDALRSVDLTVRVDEFVAIMGSSGSGKSTLMNIFGCLDPPTTGHYFLEGVDVGGLSEPELARIRSERLGFVFQSFNLLARTSAIENVGLPLYYAATGPLRRAVRTERAKRALQFVGLGERERNTPGQLSGGQQQRVAIARALINTPSLLLADEPTGNLDTRTSHEIMETLVTLQPGAWRDDRRRHARARHRRICRPDRHDAGRRDRLGSARDKTPKCRSETPPERARSADASRAQRAGQQWLPVVRAHDTCRRGPGDRTQQDALGAHHAGRIHRSRGAYRHGRRGQTVRARRCKRRSRASAATLVVILPGAISTGGIRAGFGSASTLTVADARALLREDPGVSAVGYLIRQQGQVEYGNQNWTTTIQGVSANYPPITNWHIAAGRGISDDDESKAALVAVIGQTVYRQLFNPGESPLGAAIEVKGVALTVVGVLSAKGQSAFGQDQDDLLMMPFSTAERKVLGVAAPNQQQLPLNWPYLPPPNPYNLVPRLTGFANQVYVQAASQPEVQAAIAQVTDTLVRRHRIKPGALKDFDVRNLSQFAETAETSSRIMALLLAAVASISLLVGGIGIMNILLVSVTERTREIGLRMAIGARRLHVLLQFLAEAVFLSVSGGLAGIVVGIALSGSIPIVFGWLAPVSAAAVAGGFAFSAAVGVFFGYYPARKAASLNPIDALRYE